MKHKASVNLMKIWSICLIIPVILLLAGCGVKFQQASLYDGFKPVEKPAKPKFISQVVEPLIFDENGSNFWTQDDPNCTTGEVTEETAYSGTTALRINWNRDPSKCEWAGFGIGWDNWAGKDLTNIFDLAAIQMHVRTQEGKMFGLPIVLTLEDYSGGLGFAYTGNKYFEKYYLDEEWQKVVIPLNAFDIEVENLDISNVKQLMFELQQAGGIFLDDIRLIFYEEPPLVTWFEEPKRANPLNFPIQLFDDGFINNNGWGLVEDNCQKIALTSKEKSEGEKAIYLSWDRSKPTCHFIQFGVSWNKWFPVDLSSVKENTAIEFDIKPGKGALEADAVQIGFEDYQRRISSVNVQPLLARAKDLSNGWKRVTIPLSTIKGPLDFSDVKMLYVAMDKTGEMYMDNIRLIKQ